MSNVKKSALSINRGPSLLVLGVQKAATTTLFDILKDANGFSAPSRKELQFFDNDYNYKKGIDWYFDQFEGEGIKFEATPDYIYSSTAAERIYEHLQDIKFVLIFRDPVKRCFSAWNMFRSFHANPSTAKYIYQKYLKYSNPDVKGPLASLLFSEKFPSFEDCVRDDIFRLKAGDSRQEPSFVRRGFYYEQVSKYLNIFDRSQFLFLDQDEVSRDTSASVKKVFQLLGLEADAESNIIQINSNVGDYQGTSVNESIDVISYLYDVYSEPNKKLFDLIGEKYCWSSSWLEDKIIGQLSKNSKGQNAIQYAHVFDNNQVPPLYLWQASRIDALEEELVTKVERAQILAEDLDVRTEYIGHLERTAEALKEALHIKTEQTESITRDWTARGEHIEHLAETIEALRSDLQKQTEQTGAVNQDWLARGEQIGRLEQTIEALRSALQQQTEQTGAVTQDWLARGEHIERINKKIDSINQELIFYKNSWWGRLGKFFRGKTG